MGRTMETVLLKQISEYVKEKMVLGYGMNLQRVHDTWPIWLVICDEITRCGSEGRTMSAIEYLKFSKIFDIVPLFVLVSKFRHYNLTGWVDVCLYCKKLVKLLDSECHS